MIGWIVVIALLALAVVLYRHTGPFKASEDADKNRPYRRF